MVQITACPSEYKNYTLGNRDEILIWCHTLEVGKNCLVRVKGFKPHIYLHLPTTGIFSYTSWNSRNVDPIISAIKWRLKKENTNYNPYKITLVKKYPWYYYSKDKGPMLKIEFTKYYACKKFQTMFENGLTYFTKKGRKQTFKPDIGDYQVEAYNQMLIQNKCTTTQWFKYNVEKIEDEEDKISYYDNEYFLHYTPECNNFESVPDEISDDFPYHPLVMAFDIETRTDNYKRMPVKYWDEHCIFMISADSKHVGTDEKVVRKVFIFGDSPEVKMDKLNDKAKKLLGKDAEDVEIVRAPSEKIMLELYFDYISILDPDIFTGYNIHAYDYPYIEERMKKYNITFPERCSRLKTIKCKYRTWSWGSSAHAKVVLHQVEWPGRYSLCMYSVVYKDFKRKLPKYNLDTVLRILLGKSKYSPVSYEDLFIGFDKQDRPRKMLNNCVKRWIPRKECTKAQLKDFRERFGKFSSEYGFIPEFHENVDDNVLYSILQLYEKGKENMLEKVIYSDYDSLGCIELFEFTNSHIVCKELAGICRRNCRDVYSVGEQQKGVSLIAYEAHWKGHSLNRVLEHNDIPFKGGYVGEMTKGLTKDCITLDFNSLYPNVQITHNFCYTTLIRDPDKKNHNPNDIKDVKVIICEQEEKEEDENGKEIKVMKTYEFWYSQKKDGIIPELQKFLIAKRKVMKKLMFKFKGTKKEIVYNARQLGIKVSGNSIYGMSGTRETGKLPCVPLSMCTAGMGRVHIHEAEDMIVEYGGTPIYGDTDSIMFTMPGIKGADCIREGKRLEKLISDRFPGTLYFEYEKCGSFFGYTKKRYIIWKYIDTYDKVTGLESEGFGTHYDMNHKDAFIITGILIARKDNCRLQRELFSDVLFGILKDETYQETVDKVFTTCIKMITGRIPWNQLLIIKGVGVSYKSKTATMKVFADKCTDEGHPLSPGDKVDFIVEERSDIKNFKVGTHACLPVIYNKKIEEGKNPKPNVHYYINNTLKKNIQQTIHIGFYKELKKIKRNKVEQDCEEIIRNLRKTLGKSWTDKFKPSKSTIKEEKKKKYPRGSFNIWYDKIKAKYIDIPKTKREKKLKKDIVFRSEYNKIHRLNIDYFTSNSLVNNLHNKNPIHNLLKVYKFDVKNDEENTFPTLRKFLKETCSKKVYKELNNYLLSEKENWEAEIDDDDDLDDLDNEGVE